MAHVPVEQRRPQLIEATIRVVARDGVARASTRRIAEEADASLASLHYSFRDKEELFAAVTEHVVARSRDALAARAIAPGAGLRAAVAETLMLFRDWTAAEPGLQAAQFELQSWALRTPHRRDLAAHCYDLYGRALADVFAATARPDEDGVDVETLARLTMVATDGIAMRILATGPDALDDVDCAVLADGLLATARATRECPSRPVGSTD